VTTRALTTLTQTQEASLVGEADTYVTLKTKDVATAVRQTLREAFPSTTFVVRARTWTDGSSVDVSWTDGPTREEVDALVEVYRGTAHWGGYDGMGDEWRPRTILLDGAPVSYHCDYVSLDRADSAHDAAARRELSASLGAPEENGATSMTASTAAYLLGMSKEGVTRAIRRGDLEGTRTGHGRSWEISIASVRAYQAQRQDNRLKA